MELFLSIAIFGEVQATKHCNAPKIPKFTSSKLTNYCIAQIQPFCESAPGLAMDASILEFLELC